MRWRFKGKPPKDTVEVGAAHSAGYGAPYHQVHERMTLPTAGADQYRWETLALPLYTPGGMGWGQAWSTPRRATDPALLAVKGVTLTTIGNPGILHGQLMTQPVLDTNEALRMGILAPEGSTPTVFNQIPTGA